MDCQYLLPVQLYLHVPYVRVAMTDPPAMCLAVMETTPRWAGHKGKLLNYKINYPITWYLVLMYACLILAASVINLFQVIFPKRSHSCYLVSVLV